MGRRYMGYGSDNNTDATTICQLTSATTIRPRIYDIILGSRAAVADYTSGYRLQRTTTAGTSGTAWTPVALDTGDPASLAGFRYADTVEPTYTSNAYLLEFNLNQRATFRWVAAPGGEIVLAAVATGNAGFGAGLLGVAPSTGAFAVQVTMYWEE